MSRLVRAGVVAGLLAATFGAGSASAAPCQVTIERHYVGGPNWTAVVMVPTVTC